MYDMDRQTTLSMYEEMFDSCTEEQSLLQYLVSPTRQAVVLARAYDSKERKFKGLEDEGEPSFVTVIRKLRADAPAMFYEENLSLFEDEPEEQESFEINAQQSSDAAQSADAESVEDEPEQESDIIPVLPMQMTVEELTEALRDEESEKPETETADDVREPEEPEKAEEEKPEDKPEEDEADKDYFSGDTVGDFADAVDAFLADFSISDGELIKSTQEEKSAEPESTVHQAEAVSLEEEDEESDDEFRINEPFFAARMRQDTAEKTKASAPARVKAEKIEEYEDEDDEEEDDEDENVLTVRKARVPLLIIYLIFAIPITLALVGLLLVPTAISFFAAVAAACVGVVVLGTAVGGFAVFAETLVVVGAGIIALALALLFLWMFIWFIGGVIVGLVRGVILLAGKWCYKEVAVR